MDLRTRKPFAENLGSGLQGLTLPTTAFLYLFSLALLVPSSVLVIRVFGQKSSDYLIPLLVLVFIIAEYSYCWRLLFQGGSARPLLMVGLIAAIIYVGYRLPADFMDRSWQSFDVIRSSLSWLFGGAVVRSILGPLALLAGYGVIHRSLIRKRWFIVVPEFRVWGKLAETIPEKGMAARLGDELVSLWKEIRARDPKRPLEPATQNVDARPEMFSAGGKVALYDAAGFSLPETQVTLEYKGISIEGVHTFIRRLTKREVVITGDLMKFQPDGLLLFARTTHDGPWEVRIEGSDSAALEKGLQKLALRIMTTLTEKFQPKAANAFVMLQIKARELEEYHQALLLAILGLRAAPDPQKGKRNLATAYNDIGIVLAGEENYAEAMLEFRKATELDQRFVEAYENLGQAYQLLEQESKAKAAFEQANKLRQGEGADRPSESISPAE